MESLRFLFDNHDTSADNLLDLSMTFPAGNITTISIK